MRLLDFKPRRLHEPAPPRRHAPSAGQWPAVAALALLLAGIISPMAQGQTFKVLYSFAGYPTDGANPEAGMVMDAAGNLYGTTTYGGSHEGCPGKWQCGTVFKLDTNGVETILYNFNGKDGANPAAPLMMDASDDLYGTTQFGGNLKGCGDINFVGCGVVFKLSSDGKETVLHRFTGGWDGWWPAAGLIMDASGALYGTASSGGNSGSGVAFRLVGRNETVLYSFTGYGDGGTPAAGLLMDRKGNLYGTTAWGGDPNCNPGTDPCGVVFKLTGNKETWVHDFRGSPHDGNRPVCDLIMDAERNLYGTTVFGGVGYGTVFEVTAAGKEKVIYSFQQLQDGQGPAGGVVRDAHGNLYGATGGGDQSYPGDVFELTKDGEEKVLYTFCSEQDCADGLYPMGDLVMDAKGNLYGTTTDGGAYRNGVVFEITP